MAINQLAAPEGGALTNADLATINANFALINTAIGSSTGAPTGTGAPVLATGPTLVAPALGTPASVVLTNATGLPSSGLLPGVLQVVKVPLTSAQIKAINAGITLVAAQGAGTYIEFISAVINYARLTASYVNGAGGAPTYVIEVGTAVVWADAVSSAMATALKAGANASALIGPPVGVNGLSSAVLNAALTLQNTAGPTFDLVTGAGSAIVCVAYRVWSGLS